MDKTYLYKARHHIVFLFALIFGSVLIYFLNQIDLKKMGQSTVKIEKTQGILERPKSRPLTPQERQWATVAWRYFEKNYQQTSGLVNSVDGFTSTTLWDTGNYLVGLISAYELKIIDEKVFHQRLTRLLQTLKTLPLYDGKLPNKVYNTQTVQMTDYNNHLVKGGIGWSVIDIGRILSPLSYVLWHYPTHTAMVTEVLQRWDFHALQKGGELYGVIQRDGKPLLLQEGRLGYEQYAAKVFTLFGVDALKSMRYNRFLDFVNIYGVEVPYDIRDSNLLKANNYVLMEPYMLDGLEFGWDSISKEFSYRLYRVQKARYEDTGILTAVTEDHIDSAPYFIYNSIYVNGQAWVAVDEKGELYPNKKLLSTKASFGMYALYRTDYTQSLMKRIASLQGKDGWYAGYYEKDGKVNSALTCNTNAVILDALRFIEKGPLLRLGE